MTSKKDFIKAAAIVQDERIILASVRADVIENAFVRLFSDDNPKFDERRFRDACKV